MIPARSAPDLQCIRAGYSIDLNSSRAPSTRARLGTSREVMTKSTMVRPRRSQASFSSAWKLPSKPPRRLMIVRTPRFFHQASWKGQGWLVRTRSGPIQWAFWKPTRR